MGPGKVIILMTGMPKDQIQVGRPDTILMFSP